MQRDFNALRNEKYDLLVIGGGIVGIWTAFDAALRGLQVALVEKNDWASGTSSASSKLIHGGLRYLEQLDFRLVYGSLKERKLLSELAPHRVRPLRFLVPVYRKSRVSPLKFRAGLMLYDLLAGRGQPVARHRKLNYDAFIESFPFINRDGLRCGFSYGDCQEDDSRMALEILDGAQQAGVHAVSYTRAEKLILEKDRVEGAYVRDILTGHEKKIHASLVVNTTGVWSGLLEGMPPGAQKLIRATKGVHLILPGMATRNAMLLTARSDGRVFFVIPWYERTLLGTTDTDYEGHPDEVQVNNEDIDYLLMEAEHALRDVHWKRKDVIGSFCGLRMLERSNEASPSATSRDWSLHQFHETLLMPLGGKYTTAREDASCIVDRAMSLLKKPTLPCPTHTQPFPWTPDEPFEQWKTSKLKVLQKLGIDGLAADYLLLRHGTNVQYIEELIKDSVYLRERIDPELPFIRAEIPHAIQNECAITPEDILRRRIPLSLLSRKKIQLREMVEREMDKNQ